MNFINSMDYLKSYPLSSTFFIGNKMFRVYIKKSFFKNENKDQYFINLVAFNVDGTVDCVGYTYFYLNPQEKTSQYIGTFIKPEYRSNGYASLLTSHWIKFCLDNDICDLSTIRKQRKPFLVYLLKTYLFEINDIDFYNRSLNCIHICRKKDDNNKYLLFDNKKQEDTFRNGKIYQGDNYSIISSSDGVEVLDTVLLSREYFLTDCDSSYNKSLTITNKFEDMV